jgi:hypothetical protein
MATESQINANREKAKFSSGPKPPKAKPNPPAITPNSVSSPSTTTLAPAGDPMIYPAYLPTQNAIDRARTSAQSGMRRAKADLDKMQAARRLESPLGVRALESPLGVRAKAQPRPFCKSNPIRPGHNRDTRTRKARPNNSNPISGGSPTQPEPSVAEFGNSPAIGEGLAPKKAA